MNEQWKTCMYIRVVPNEVEGINICPFLPVYYGKSGNMYVDGAQVTHSERAHLTVYGTNYELEQWSNNK